MITLKVLLGIVALTLGRRLFWPFVGAVGFVAGIALADRFLEGQPDWMILGIALAAGLVGALLAVFLQRLAFGLAGFIGGGDIAINLLGVLGWETGPIPWLPFLTGGIIGLMLVAAVFDLALIILSSLVGAALIVEATRFGPQITAFLFAILLVVGIMIQTGLMRRTKPERALRPGGR